jgi:uncharacterized membrane protein
MYSKPIGFFFNNKEKIGTYLGLVLTIIYTLISLILFIVHLALILQHSDMKVYDSTAYSKDLPTIDINPDLIYFAFGVEDPKTSNRFIDETIYYPKFLFFYRDKVNGEFKTTKRIELESEVCKEESFGQDYQNIIVKGELNNSYCLKNFNLTLKGGYKYENMSYLRIRIYPCINTTENNHHCKPQEVIDNYLKGGYISILTKDIGLNPINYSFPIISTLQDLYSTIDKQIYRDYILYYGITEIKTDTGLFIKQINSKRYLQFRKEVQSFYFRDESEYYGGKAMCSIDFRLDDLIITQTREYTKIPEVFAVVGGYMNLITTIFTLLSILVNRLYPQLEILNGIFNFNLKKNKMTLKIYSIKDFNSNTFTKNFIFFSDKEVVNNFSNKTQQLNNNNKTNLSKNSLIVIDNNNSSVINIFNNKNPNLLIKQNENKNIINNKKSINSFNNINNKMKASSLPYNNNGQTIYDDNSRISNSINDMKVSYIYKVKSLYPKIAKNQKYKSRTIIRGFDDQINFNIFEYYCFRKFSKKKKDIALFNSGLSFFKRRMDIISVFTLLLLSEKNCLQSEL